MQVRRGAEAEQDVVKERRANRAVGALLQHSVHAEVPSAIVDQERRGDASLYQQLSRRLLRVWTLSSRSTERIHAAVRATLREPLERHLVTHTPLGCSLRDEASLPAQKTADARQAVLIGEQLHAMYSGVADGCLVDALAHTKRHGHHHFCFHGFAETSLQPNGGKNKRRDGTKRNKTRRVKIRTGT